MAQETINQGIQLPLPNMPDDLIHNLGMKWWGQYRHMFERDDCLLRYVMIVNEQVVAYVTYRDIWGEIKNGV